MLFIGEYEHTLDEKNRLMVPSRLRECMDEALAVEGIYVTRGFEGCLYIYPKRHFDAVVEQLQKAPFTRAQSRSLQRLFFSQAAFCPWDKQGRILIPEGLKEMAGIVREVTLVGVSDHIEVWDRERWKGFRRTNDGQFETLAETVFPAPDA
ncbi:MAG: division/cell wall cluster transcriptional repressor MraZ [Planctomycetota bacterium]